MALKKPSEYFKQKEEVSPIDERVQELVKMPELNTFSDAFESFKSNLTKIEVLSEFSDTLDNYRINIERVNHISERVEDIQTEIQSLLKKEDLDRAMMSQLLVVEQSIRDVQNKVKGINEKSLTEIRLDVSGLTKSVNEFLEVEVPKYKRLVVDSELRTDSRYQELEKNVNETLEGIGEFVDNKYQELTETLQGINESSLSGIIEDFKTLDETVSKLKEEEIPKYKGFIVETERKTEFKLNEFEEKIKDTVNDVLEIVTSVESINSTKIEEVETLQKKVNSELQSVEEHKKELDKRVVDLEVEILKNESHIKKQNDHIEDIQEEIRGVISKLHIDQIEEKNYELVKKVNYLEEVFDKFNVEKLTEGLLNEPPEVDNRDPLTPLDQNFVTLDQLQQHYRLFINRIQQQLSTLGGGGETRLKYLDDIVGIATNSNAYNGKFLQWNSTINKAEFVTVTGGGGGVSGIGLTIGPVPPVDPITYPLWYDSILGRSFVYYSDNDSTQWVDFSPPGGNNLAVVTNVTSITGVTTYYQATTNDDYIGVSASVPVTIVLPTSPITGKKIIVKDEGNNISTYNITVRAGIGASVENDSSVVMNVNHQSFTYFYNGSNWFLI